MRDATANSPQQKLRLRPIMWAVSTIGLLVLVGFLVSGPLGQYFDSPSSAGEEVDEVKPLPVNVAEVEFVESIMQSRSYTGMVRARNRSELGFELTGKIKSVNVDEGDLVARNQVLAELDTETLDAQKGAILARLAQAKSVLDELTAGPRNEKIQAARANMDATQSQYDSLVLNLKRRKRLRDAGAISAEEYDDAAFAEKTGQANLAAAQQQLSELESGTRSEQLEAQRSVVTQLEASAKEIEVAILKSKLVAPFAGVVTRRYLDPGSIAQASVAVIKLVEQEHLEAWIGLPVDIVADLEIGSRHEIIVGRDRYFAVATAKIAELDPATRTQTIVFAFETPAAERLVSGQLCEVLVRSAVDTPGYWIPTSALAKGVRGLWSVMVMTPEATGSGFRARKRDIEIIKTDSNRVLAQGTIAPGDRIIVDGVHRIAEGQLVVPSDRE